MYILVCIYVCLLTCIYFECMSLIKFWTVICNLQMQQHNICTIFIIHDTIHSVHMYIQTGIRIELIIIFTCKIKKKKEKLNKERKKQKKKLETNLWLTDWFQFKSVPQLSSQCRCRKLKLKIVEKVRLGEQKSEKKKKKIAISKVILHRRRQICTYERTYNNAKKYLRK